MTLFADEQIIMVNFFFSVTNLEHLAEQKVVLNFKMKIASVTLLMVSTFLAICSRVSLSNKRECQVWGMFSVT